VLRKTSVLLLLFSLAAGLTGAVLNGAPPTPTLAQGAEAARDVFLVGTLPDEDLLTLTTAVTASGHPGVILLDSPRFNRYTTAFLQAFQARQVVPVGSFPRGEADLDRRLPVEHLPICSWEQGPPAGLLKSLFPEAKKVVVCPAEPHRLLLQAACLAGVARAPLFVSHGRPEDVLELQQALQAWNTQEVFAVGDTYRLCRGLASLRVVRLLDENAVFQAYLRRQLQHGPISSLVVANPADTRPGLGSMSTLAPWIALQHRAALLLTNDAGTNAKAVVRTALKNEHLVRADALILVANLQAIPVEQRPNPMPGGKDVMIEMEPLTPADREPVSFATGRLFHEDRGVVALMLARQRLLAEAHATPRALVASNPGGSLPLLETFSRNTASELRNAGYETTPLFGRQTNKAELRRLLPEQTIFLWEGHHSTLVRDYGIHQWSEPLQPSLVFLQSCLALAEPKAQPFLRRGAVGVIATSSRTYSGSGGALALAFFDALLYEDQSVGAALRSAKNFMLAFSQLKEKRLGPKTQLGGANIRAAWAFTLWGDPTVKLPRPVPPDGALDAVRHHVHGNTIVLALPDATHDKVVTVKYQTTMRANARLAGLLTKQEEAEGHRLVPLAFAEVHLPNAPPGKTPRLHGRLPESRWVFCYDARRRCGSLLVMPRARDSGELRFRIEWE
jgi:hypothetical protein